jgi:hypothetical protein
VLQAHDCVSDQNAKRDEYEERERVLFPILLGGGVDSA